MSVKYALEYGFDALEVHADSIIHGQRVLPERAQALGFHFEHPELDEALRSALAG